MEENKKDKVPEKAKPPNNEEQVNNLLNHETFVPAEITSEVEQPQTTNYKPETEDMEVHHHTHAAHGKKNWKSYFWEFLMLFLVCSVGF